MKFPRHEQPAAQEICARITSAVFQETCSFWVKGPRKHPSQKLLSKIAQPWYSPGNGHSAHAERHVAKRWIAAKKFIPTQARNRHFQSKFSCRFAEEPSIEAINGRLVHGLENFGQIVAKLLLGHDTRRMSRAILRRNICSNRGLVLARPPKFFEGDSNRLDILLSDIAHQANESTGVNPAGKECANRHIGYEVMAHAIEECLPGDGAQIVISSGRSS